MSDGDRFNWLEFGRALAGIIVIAGLMALTVLAAYRGGSGPALGMILVYSSLALVLFGLKGGIDIFGAADSGADTTDTTDENGGRN